MAGARRKARIIALQILYEIDSAGHPLNEVVEHNLSDNKISEENAAFVKELVNGVFEHKQEIDKRLHTLAPAWPVQQIAIVDRNILRLAIFEILFDNKVPVKVAINEAVELAKKFASDGSAKFVNGVLGSVSALANR